jgi:hypothetical protein
VVHPFPRRRRARRRGRGCVVFRGLSCVTRADRCVAERAAERMVRAADFDPRMLRLALQMASERGMRALLWATLDLLLRAVRGGLGQRLAKLDYGVEGITLVRCLVRLGREELNGPSVDAYVPVERVVELSLMLWFGSEAVIDALLDHLSTGSCNLLISRPNIDAMAASEGARRRSIHRQARSDAGERPLVDLADDVQPRG